MGAGAIATGAVGIGLGVSGAATMKAGVALGRLPNSNLGDAFDKARMSHGIGIDLLSGNIEKYSDMAKDAGTAMLGAGHDKIQSGIDMMQKFDDMIANLKGINKNTAETAKAAIATALGLNEAQANLVGRVLANIAEDTHFNLSRI